MNKLGCVIAFVSGAVVGSVGSWYILKTKYERIAQEEIDSVKEVFVKRMNSNVVETNEEESELVCNKAPDNNLTEKPDIMEYAKKLSQNGYVDYSTNSESSNETDEQSSIYVISPDEFGEGAYEVVSLSYYTDNVLADDEDNEIEDIENTVGYDSLTHFGEYEEDCVFVRNEKLQIDYEILRDIRTFESLVQNGLYTR